MALPFFNWSRTAASNATADSTVNWAEDQAPSSVNDSARAMMASTAAYRDDTAGAIATGGSATAYTLTTYQVFSSLSVLNGQLVAFTPHATNTNAVGVDITLNVDGLGAKSIRAQPGVALPGGSLILGTPYVVLYNSSDAVFYLHNSTNPYNVPLAGGMDYWGATVPNSSFAFPIGQQVSQTTYATLYALFGPNKYGTDGGGLFYLPDKTGRVSAMKEASASRLTSTYFVGNSTSLGAVGGLESHTLTTAQLASHSHTGVTGAASADHTHVQSGTFTSTGQSVDHAHTYSLPNAIGQGTSGGGLAFSNGTTPTVTSGVSVDHSHNVTISGQTGGMSATHTHAIAVEGGGTAHNNVQPTIICNYIMRII